MIKDIVSPPVGLPSDVINMLLSCTQSLVTWHLSGFEIIHREQHEAESGCLRQSWDSHFASDVQLSARFVGTVTWHPFISAYSLQGHLGLEIIPANTGRETGFTRSSTDWLMETNHHILSHSLRGARQTHSSSLWKNSPISNLSVVFT